MLTDETTYAVSRQRVERRPLAFDKQERSAVETVAQVGQPPAELALVGNHETGGGGRRGRTRICGEIAERRVLLVSDSGDDGTGLSATARTRRSSLNGSRSSKLPPPRASTITSTWARGQVAERRCERGSGATALHVCLSDEDAGCRETGGDGRDEVRFAAASFPVSRAIRGGKRAAAVAGRRREEAFGREASFQTLDPGEHGTQAEGLDRERASLNSPRAA